MSPANLCIGYLAHPFEEWIACRCKCAHSDLFTLEELQFKNDAIQTEEEAKKIFPLQQGTAKKLDSDVG